MHLVLSPKFEITNRHFYQVFCIDFNHPKLPNIIIKVQWTKGLQTIKCLHKMTVKQIRTEIKYVSDKQNCL